MRIGHGPLGALYPTNTGLRQKEGDTMAFLYLLPTGMNDPQEPTWGSWAGRYGPNEEHPGKPYFWANQKDAWRGTTSRDNTLARWAADLQNDFRARMDWCVKPRAEANHRPNAVLNGQGGSEILRLDAKPGSVVELNAQRLQRPRRGRDHLRVARVPRGGHVSARNPTERGQRPNDLLHRAGGQTS